MEENIKKILEEAQQEEKELRTTEEDWYNGIKLRIQQENCTSTNAARGR